MASSYSIGDELSSSNYLPQYCNQCQADTAKECTCDSSKTKTTAVAHAVTPILPIQTPISHDDLVNTVLTLPKKEFWDLVDMRLNRPKGIHVVTNALVKELYAEIIELNDKPSIVEIERWTENCLVEQLFLELATTKLLVSHEGNCGITVHKYYNEAFRIFRYLPVARPTPEFVINLSDLSTRIVAELKVLHDPSDILKQAVGTIFENIDAWRYHLSIASLLKVRLVK